MSISVEMDCIESYKVIEHNNKHSGDQRDMW